MSRKSAVHKFRIHSWFLIPNSDKHKSIREVPIMNRHRDSREKHDGGRLVFAKQLIKWRAMKFLLLTLSTATGYHFKAAGMGTQLQGYMKFTFLSESVTGQLNTRTHDIGCNLHFVSYGKQLLKKFLKHTTTPHHGCYFLTRERGNGWRLHVARIA